MKIGSAERKPSEHGEFTFIAIGIQLNTKWTIFFYCATRAPWI